MRILLDGEFLWDHGIAVSRHGRAGHDAHAFARLDLAAMTLTGMHTGNDAQAQGKTLCQVVAAQGIAIHGRIVVGWHIDGRDDVFGQHSIKRTADGDLLDGGQRGDEIMDDLLCLRHRHGVRVVAGDATDDVRQ